MEKQNKFTTLKIFQTTCANCKHNHYFILFKINRNISYVFNTYKIIKWKDILKTQPMP